MIKLPKDKRSQSPAYWHAKKQERSTAKRLGGRVTPASGSKGVKGDVRVNSCMRIECKATSNKSFSLTREMLEKIENAALGSGEIPAMEIEFLPLMGNYHGKVAIVPIWVLESLIQKESDE